jgi:hypothetical protein
MGPRVALVVALIGVTVGGLLMLGSVLQGRSRDRIADAPVCTDEQVFAASRCRAVLDGTVVSLTHERVELIVDDRPVAMSIQIVGDTSGEAGVPVRVTFYDGKPIHIEGSSLNIDGENTPASRSWDLFNAALFFLIGVPILAGVNIVIWLARRG